MFLRTLSVALVGMSIYALGLQAQGLQTQGLQTQGKDVAASGVTKEPILTLPVKILKEKIPTMPAKTQLERIPTLPARFPFWEAIPALPSKGKKLKDLKTPLPAKDKLIIAPQKPLPG